MIFLNLGKAELRLEAYSISKINAAINGGIGFPAPSWITKDDWIYQTKTNLKEKTLFVGDSYLHMMLPGLKNCL